MQHFWKMSKGCVLSISIWFQYLLCKHLFILFSSYMNIARQMWCLGKFLPLVIGSSVPNDDERWLHFLLLLMIVDIVFSPMASLNDLGILEGYIEEYLWQFTCIYPGRSVIPKMHYLVHYPAHIYKLVFSTV